MYICRDIFFIVESAACLEDLHNVAVGCDASQKIHVFYTGTEEKIRREWKRACVTWSCAFASLADVPPLDPPCYAYPCEIASLRVYRWLQEQTADIVCFEGMLGFHCLQARKVLGAFAQIAFVVLAESGLVRASLPLQITRERFCRAYCVQHADAVWNGVISQDGLRLPSEKKRPSFAGILHALRIKHISYEGGGGTSHGMISVCVAHYNYPRFLPIALESLARQDYKNFEVIVADDGSTDPEALHEFDAQECLMDTRFRFFHKKNGGAGDTRNFCAAHAKGDYLVFMDADNVATPHMLRTFAESMARTGADALTCHFEGFASEETDIPPRKCKYLAVPTGQDLVTSTLENTLGDTNMIVRKDVFLKLGGMCSTRTGVEDWEFLVRLGLAGFRQDVVPQPLFYYRLTPEGISRNTTHIDRLSCISAAYAQYGLKEPLAQDLLKRVTIPYYTMVTEGSFVTGSVFLRQAFRIGLFLEALYQRWFPAASRRQRFATAFRNFFQRNL